MMISLCCLQWISQEQEIQDWQTMSMRSFSPHNSPTAEAQRISLETRRKQEKQKETGTKIFLQLWSGSHPGLCSVPAALCCQNLPEPLRISQNSGISTRKFHQRAPQTPLWYCFSSSQTPELLPVFPAIALSFRLSANPDVFSSPGFQVEICCCII